MVIPRTKHQYEWCMSEPEYKLFTSCRAVKQLCAQIKWWKSPWFLLSDHFLITSGKWPNTRLWVRFAVYCQMTDDHDSHHHNLTRVSATVSPSIKIMKRIQIFAAVGDTIFVIFFVTSLSFCSHLSFPETRREKFHSVYNLTGPSSTFRLWTMCVCVSVLPITSAQRQEWRHLSRR